MPEPDLLLTGAEVQAVTNRTMPSALADAIAVMATGAVRDYCGWRVAKTAAETFTVRSSGSAALFLPSLHVVSVDSVTEDGVVLAASDFEWDAGGVLERVGVAGWKTGRRTVTVTVTHGYESCPGGVAQAVASSVARGAFTPAGGIASETALGQTFVYSRMTAGGLAAGQMFVGDELARLDQHRIPASR